MGSWGCVLGGSLEVGNEQRQQNVQWGPAVINEEDWPLTSRSISWAAGLQTANQLGHWEPGAVRYPTYSSFYHNYNTNYAV